MNGYRLILASSVGSCDGFSIELDAEDGQQIAEVFEDGLTKKRTVSFFVNTPVPLEVVQWLLEKAETDL